MLKQVQHDVIHYVPVFQTVFRSSFNVLFLSVMHRCKPISEASGDAMHRCKLISEVSGDVMHRCKPIPEVKIRYQQNT